MRLVFIYGAPAVGKRTVARELAALTGWKYHHDHMAVDLAVALFEFDDPNFLRLRERIHLATLEAAAAGGLPGLVFAYCVGGAWDDAFVAGVIARYGADVCFARLSCTLEEEQRRVTGADRKQFRKLAAIGPLMDVLRADDFSRVIDHPNHFALDTTDLSAAAAARAIAGRFSLPRASLPA